MLKRQEVTLVITYDDTIYEDPPSQWGWEGVVELNPGEATLKGYSEPQDVDP